MFEDKTLVCKDCGKEFVWTAGEQEFYASRGFENPRRAPDVRRYLRQLRQGLQGSLPASRGPSGLLQRVLR